MSVEICTYGQAVGKGICSGGERMYGSGNASFVVYEGDEWLGEISFNSRYEDSQVGDYNVLMIARLNVKEERRRQGIGGRLLQELLNNYGVNIIGLFTEIDNPAKDLYERVGFKVMEQGVDPDAWGSSVEEAEKVIYMERPAHEGQGNKLECTQREYYQTLFQSWEESSERLKGLKEAVNA
jgi:predicted N-acetyltransferase YhbS